MQQLPEWVSIFEKSHIILNVTLESCLQEHSSKTVRRGGLSHVLMAIRPKALKVTTAALG
jgi:hypothetical protein